MSLCQLCDIFSSQNQTITAALAVSILTLINSYCTNNLLNYKKKTGSKPYLTCLDIDSFSFGLL